MAAARDLSCIKEEVVKQGRWLQLSNILYKDAEGKSRIWETVKRTTRPEKSDVDSVGVLAVLKRTLRSDCFILVKQFRPPLDAFTLEFPAGLIGANESPENTAIRELKEETGYIGKVKTVGPAVAVDPGISDSTMRMVTIEIDGDNPNNVNPVQRKSDQAFIEVVHIPISELFMAVMDYSKQGVIVDSRVQAFSLGFAKGTPKKNQLSWIEAMDEK